jgi:uncharacterized protein YecE (DUF72 family)
MRVRVGTSGYSYKEWKGTFYPEDLPASEMLRYYAGRHDTVEINNTFYRMPSRKLLEGWAEQVSPEFSFVLKAPQRITHHKKLANAAEDTAFLLQSAQVMGDTLGPFLFQLPPWFKKDAPRLKEFLGHLPAGTRAAFEFRNSTWFDDETYDVLRSHGVALAVSDTDGETEPAVVPTADYGYLRLRRAGYDRAVLAAWAERVQAQPWSAAWVFFKHEEAGTGPRLASSFRELLAPR